MEFQLAVELNSEAIGKQVKKAPEKSLKNITSVDSLI